MEGPSPALTASIEASDDAIGSLLRMEEGLLPPRSTASRLPARVVSAGSLRELMDHSGEAVMGSTAQSGGVRASHSLPALYVISEEPTGHGLHGSHGVSGPAQSEAVVRDDVEPTLVNTLESMSLAGRPADGAQAEQIPAATPNRSVRWSHAEIISLSGSMENIVALVSEAPSGQSLDHLCQRDIETGHGDVSDVVTQGVTHQPGHAARSTEMRLIGSSNLPVGQAGEPDTAPVMAREWLDGVIGEERAGGQQSTLSVPIQSRPLISDFLGAHAQTSLATWIKRLSSLAMLKFTP